MLGAKPNRYREGWGLWVITPIALSLVIHAIILNLMPEFSPLGLAALREQLRKTFHITASRGLAPAVVESLAREVGPAATEEPVDLASNAAASVQPLGSEAALVKPDEPTGIGETPAGPGDLAQQPERPPTISPAHLSSVSRRLLAGAGQDSPPLSVAPDFLNRYRSIGPAPQVDFGPLLRLTVQGEIVGADVPQGGAEFIAPAGDGALPGLDLGLPPVTLPAGAGGSPDREGVIR